ncbi:SpoIIE family protein phosphatase [Streptomyces sparsogenes]|uniref:Magnesium or manganese-dependent protein phosphatase n=1 Tax=Streptomyces sparsogenes DSM 40356 TaxID=1331668 RepID=A0A1R1SPJ3_9ACTN|nr:SpoIIE family protein phosphatase [Streptomyces sparsogenes]OMI40142.1 magnesium or manganese-dependent protein phosphatase [Streptomyces sparsogenes DSM 40356]
MTGHDSAPPFDGGPGGGPGGPGGSSGSSGFDDGPGGGSGGGFGGRGHDPFDEAVTARATINADAVVTSWNEGARRLLGHLPAEVVGRDAAALLAEEVSPDAVQAAAALPRWNGTLTLRHRDGHPVRVRLLAHRGAPSADGPGDWLLVSPLPGPDEPTGNPKATGAAEPTRNIQDVIEQAEDEALQALASQQSPCPVAIYDDLLRLRKINDQMAQVIGLPEKEIRGLRLSEIGGRLESEELERHMAEVLRTGERRVVETHRRVGGEAHAHAWSARLAPLKTPDGEVHGVCLAAHDITEQYLARQRLLLLSEASVRIGTTLDVTRTAQELADVGIPGLADFVSVDLLERLDQDEPFGEPPPGPLTGPVVLRRAAHQSVLPGAPEAVVKLGQVDTYPSYSPQTVSLTAGHPVIIPTTDPAMSRWASESAARATTLRVHGFHSIMSVPIRARGVTLGVAVFSRHTRPDPFTQDDILLAEEITTRAAVCLDNARRFTRERDTALALQRSLLPQALAGPTAVEVAFRYQPAGPYAGVGGDWFDVIPLSGARIALVVGDVVGHGIQASATMGRLRTAVRTLADVDLPPDELLTHLDDLVIHLSAEGGAGAPTGDVGATCLYAVYDPVAHRCSVARAGHPPPVLLDPDGTVSPVHVPAGPPLGVGGLPFEAIELDLPEDTVLALYTDGLIGGRGRDLDAGLSTLTEALARPAPSLDARCECVLRALLPEQGAPDDVALLLARTRGLDSSRVATWDIPDDPALVARARRDVTERLLAWGLDEAVFTTELIVSELVTNAMRHATAPIQLRLIHDRTLICEVSDGSNTAPHLRRARVFDEGGRGLLLVAQLSRRWGSRHSATGKTIWAEQALPPPSPA